MSKRKVTIEDLAAMVQRGFKEMAKKTDMDRGFSAVNDRLDRIEKLILADHKRRIERLEEQVQDLRDLFAVR
jgi:archaellum component FlaC